MTTRALRPVALLVMLCVACTASAQQQKVATALASVNVASAAFVAFDAAHQQALVAQASTKEAAQASLTEWRAEQAKVLTLLVAAYRGVAAAATVVNQPNIDGMLAALAQLSAELQVLGVKL